MFSAVNKKQAYIRAMKQIDKIAAKLNIPPEDAALQIISTNKPAFEQFVIDNGQVPESDNRNLAAQVALIHEYKIWKTVKGGVPNYDAAEDVVLSEQQQAEDLGGNAFDATLLGTAFKAARAALPKINAKRIAAGKKPLLAGEKGQAFLNKIGQHLDIVIKDAPKETTNGRLKNTDIGIIGGALKDQITKEKTIAAVKEYLPIGILILVAVYILGKHHK